MTSEDARDRFCAEIDRRLQSIRDKRAPSCEVSESWWPFPDSIHSTALEIHSRRSSVSHSSVFSRTATTLTPTTATRRSHGRSLSAQDIWHDPNKDSKGNVIHSNRQRQGPPDRERVFPEQYEPYFQQQAQNTRKPLLRKTKATSNLKSVDLEKSCAKGTGYEEFDDDAFGTRQAPPGSERKPSLLSLELKPDEVLIEEEEEARRQMEGFTWPHGILDRFGEKIRSPGEESLRRDSGYDSICGDGDQGRVLENMTGRPEDLKSEVSNYDFAQQDYTW